MTTDSRDGVLESSSDSFPVPGPPHLSSALSLDRNEPSDVVGARLKRTRRRFLFGDAGLGTSTVSSEEEVSANVPWYPGEMNQSSGYCRMTDPRPISNVTYFGLSRHLSD